jgi:hypothetical protein
VNTIKNHGYYLSISLKLTIQSTEKCWKILTLLGTRKRSKCSKLYTDTINRVGEKLEQFLSTSGVKRRQLAPVSLSLSSTQYPTLSTRNGISQLLTLDGFRTLKLEASREDNYAEPITPTRAKCSRSSSPIMLTIRPSFSQPRRSDRRLKLISHFLV